MCVSALFVTAALHAEDVSAKFSALMDQIRNGETISFDYDYFTAYENVASTVVSAGIFFSDSNADVRYQAYRYASIAALKSENDSLKMLFVEDLVRSCNDSASIVVQNAYQQLEKFERSCFSDEAKNLLENAVQKERFFPERAVLVGGYVGSDNMKSVIMDIKSLLTKKSQRWNADVALARLGAKTSIESVISTVSGMNLDLKFIDVILPSLLYTRQRDIYDWLLNKCLSDDCSCGSYNPMGGKSTPCAYYIMYEIADYITGFPIKRDEDGDKDDEFSKSDVKKMRDWILSNPNYEIVDLSY